MMKRSFILTIILCIIALPCYADPWGHPGIYFELLVLMPINVVISAIVIGTVSLQKKWLTTFSFFNVFLQLHRISGDSIDFDKRCIKELPELIREPDLQLFIFLLLYISIPISIIKITRFIIHLFKLYNS